VRLVGYLKRTSSC